MESLHRFVLSKHNFINGSLKRCREILTMRQKVNIATTRRTISQFSHRTIPSLTVGTNLISNKTQDGRRDLCNFTMKWRRPTMPLCLRHIQRRGVGSEWSREALSDYKHVEPDSRKIEDMLFDMLEEDGNVNIEYFTNQLLATGLRAQDFRLKECMENLRMVKARTRSPLIDRATFKWCITDNIVLVSRALMSKLRIPDFPEFSHHIDQLYYSAKEETSGEVATYIPQLARMDPSYWGVSACTVSGQRYSIGDTENLFTIQSVSKPVIYAIASTDLGTDYVHQMVGKEPSGQSFNEISLNQDKQPFNPLINAGAIVICSMLKPETGQATRYDYVHEYFKRLAGGEPVGFSNAVFLSEKSSADRNFALAYYMRENKCFPGDTDLKSTLDLYFQTCSLEVNCESISVIAATLANGGICPLTGDKIFSPAAVRNTLSLMFSCGMYDYSGQFAFKVGLPAKSGVSGAILLVVPGVCGFGIWAPPLDHLGNSVKGVHFCNELVNKFSFHNFDSLYRKAQKKIDPTRKIVETQGNQIVNMLFAAANGDITAFRRYLLSDVDMDLADYDGRTALHLASVEGHTELVKFLLEKCSINHKPKDRWGRTPLDEAVTFGQTDVVKILENSFKDTKPEQESSKDHVTV